MSWFSQNYEKAAIGGAAVVAIGLAVLGWSKVGAVDEEFVVESSSRMNRDPAIASADRVAQAKALIAVKRQLGPGDAAGRAVDLFTGVPLFVDRDAPTVGIDLLTSPPVHAPIPNEWWIKHAIDPGYADSPQRDPDSDGFSNLEEFLAGTDPIDPDSFPSLVDKLKYVRDESLQWILRPGTEDDGGFAFEYGDDKGGENRASVANIVKPGELFFREGVMKERFKLLGSEVREQINPRTKNVEERTWVRIEDQRPNKLGQIYEIPASFPRDRPEDFYQYDRSAVFVLDAVGLEGTEFVVEENTTFSLPPDGKANDHTLLKVTPASVSVEHPAAEGERAVLEIPKGN
jgi:hypothetical protein